MTKFLEPPTAAEYRAVYERGQQAADRWAAWRTFATAALVSFAVVVTVLLAVWR